MPYSRELMTVINEIRHNVHVTFGNEFIIVSEKIYHYCGKETTSLKEKNIIQRAVRNNLSIS